MKLRHNSMLNRTWDFINVLNCRIRISARLGEFNLTVIEHSMTLDVWMILKCRFFVSGLNDIPLNHQMRLVQKSTFVLTTWGKNDAIHDSIKTFTLWNFIYYLTICNLVNIILTDKVCIAIVTRSNWQKRILSSHLYTMNK